MPQLHILTGRKLDSYQQHLVEDERSGETIGKYMRDVKAFLAFLPREKTVDKETVIAYKKYLSEHYKGSSANSMLVALNGLLSFLGWDECRVKLLRTQRQNYRKPEKELNKEEYRRLLKAAKERKNERLYLLMQAICSTGVRVSEHRFITVEALRDGHARVTNKGKERVVLLPAELVTALSRYCSRRGITTGPVFITRSGKPMNRSNIWAAMKQLSREARVDPAKIYPHNLRHLFALSYYQLEKDLVHLADILGHSSVETTRIYTATSGLEQQKVLSRLGLLGCGA